MHRILWSNYDWPGLIDPVRAAGWSVLAGDERNWWTWRDRHPAQFGEYLIESVRESHCDTVVLGKGLDSNTLVEDGQTHYWHVLGQDLEQLRGDGIVVVLLDLDAPDSTGWILSSGIASNSDAIGTCCIGVEKVLRVHTRADVFEFWPAWDQVARTPQPARDSWEHDLLIVGSPYSAPNPEYGIPRREIARIGINLGLRVAIYGSDWWLSREGGGDPELEPYYRGPAAWSDLERIFTSGKLAYNCFLRRGYRYLNDRVPIVGGAGAFLFSETQDGIGEEFPEGVMCGYHAHNDRQDAEAQMARWASDDAWRMRCAAAMQAHILAHHTYEQRAEVVMAAIERAHERRAGERA